ncbi:MAG: phosphate acyltransferase PlsX [Akkermansiaceae bacterium]|jgi:glycerol-3-phosphate acyltransferase PlsX|nr:phosphate acyltransferase PlsX [Akkermansiaceae bacterium]
MKIALDAMGGDNAPDVVIRGSKDALARQTNIEKLFLVGDEKIIKAECEKHGLNDRRVQIVHATEVIAMHESALKALRSKKNSSVSVATDLVKSGEADAVISAGNTGAAVAAATLKLRLLKGVERAGIASPLPNEFGICNILDAGANPEAKPSHLIGYAVMGSVYAKHVLRVASPSVGLMSNGEEDEKGTSFTKETFCLLKELADSGKAPFEFLGNVEGHDLFQSKLDVCLCDGFTGNIVLKSCEATARAMATWLKIEFKRSPLRLMGAALGQGAFKAVKDRTNYESYGGSPLLGVNGVCIIAHGSSSALAINNAIRVASEAIEHRVNPHIEEALAALA